MASNEEILARAEEAERPWAHPREWEDVSDALRGAASQLAEGQMVHTEGFRLHEAMNATEIGDAKMDSGLYSAQTRSLRDWMSGERPLQLAPTPEQCGAICERLLNFEAGFFLGESLGHTVMQCVFLHVHERIRDCFLRGFAVLTLKSMEIVRAVIITADIYEEEDFYSPRLVYECADRYSARSVLLEATRLEGALRAAIKASRHGPAAAGADEDEAALVPVAEAAAAADADAGARNGIGGGGGGGAGKKKRRRGKKKDKKAADGADDKAGDDEEADEDGKGPAQEKQPQQQPPPPQQQQQQAPEHKQGLEPFSLGALEDLRGAAEATVAAASSGDALLALVLHLRLRRLAATAHFNLLHGGARAVPQAVKCAERALAALEELRTLWTRLPEAEPIGFDPLLMRAVIASAPPRRVRERDRAGTLSVQESVLREVVALGFLASATTLQQVVRRLTAFSERRPLVLPRSHVKSLLLGEETGLLGRAPISAWVRDALSEFGTPLAVSETPQSYLDNFLAHTSGAVRRFLRLHTLNRVHQRSEVVKVMREWAPLQHDCSVFDKILISNLVSKREDLRSPERPLPRVFLEFVMDWALQLASHYLSLGFELGLYSPREFCFIWFYLMELTRMHLVQYWNPDRLTLDAHLDAEARRELLRWKAKRRTDPSLPPPKMPMPPPPPRDRWSLWLQTYLHLHEGSLRSFQAASKLGVHPVQPYTLSSEEVNLAMRLHGLSALAIPFFSGEEYRRANDIALVAAQRLLDGAVASFKAARGSLDQLAKHAVPPSEDEAALHKALTKLCISNVVFLLGLEKAIDKAGGHARCRLQWNFDLHRVFPVLSLAPVAVRPDGSV